MSDFFLFFFFNFFFCFFVFFRVFLGLSLSRFSFLVLISRVDIFFFHYFVFFFFLLLFLFLKKTLERERRGFSFCLNCTNLNLVSVVCFVLLQSSLVISSFFLLFFLVSFSFLFDLITYTCYRFICPTTITIQMFIFNHVNT